MISYVNFCKHWTPCTRMLYMYIFLCNFALSFFCNHLSHYLINFCNGRGTCGMVVKWHRTHNRGKLNKFVFAQHCSRYSLISHSGAVVVCHKICRIAWSAGMQKTYALLLMPTIRICCKSYSMICTGYNFWKLWPRKFIVSMQMQLPNLHVTFLHQGHRIKVKV